jgi:anti-anti-sigma factor
MSIDKDSKQNLIEIKYRDAVVIAISREKAFLSEHAAELSKLLQQFSNKNTNRVILDLSNCSYMSSEGIGIIITFWKRYNIPGFRFAVVFPANPDDQFKSILEIASFDRFLGAAMHTSLENALQFVRS